MITQKLPSLISTPPLKAEKKVSHYLRGDVTLPIHTKTARELCQGSWASYQKMGLFQFAKTIAIIYQSAAQDDPYADWHIDKLKKALLAINQAIKNTITLHEQALQQWQGRLEIEVFGSRNPLKLLLNFGTPLGYVVAYTIADLDYLLRQTYTFKRLGIFPESQETGFKLVWQMKDVLAQCRQWRHTGVTRHDYREKNKTAERAIALMGILPSRILKQKSKLVSKKESASSVKN
jgi:integrating conjugative element protein (TIGR03761 family)